MNINTIPALDARRQLGELLERVYYQNQQFRIMRKDKPMAWLVGDTFMEHVATAIDYIIDHDPVLADSLALSLNTELQYLLEQGTKEREEGKLVPLESILDE